MAVSETVLVHTGVRVRTRAVEGVAVAAARSVVGVASVEPTLATMAAGVGHAVRDAASGRSMDETANGVDADSAGNGMRIEMCVSVEGRNAREVCADLARTVRQEVWQQLAVQVVSVRTIVVHIAPLTVDELGE